MLRFIVCIIFCSLIKAQVVDYSILKTINAKTYPVWDASMRGVSFSVYPAMPASVIGIWTHGHLTKSKNLKRDAFKGAFTIGLALATTSALKLAIDRPRPYVTYANEIIKRDEAGPHSFPSGHTTAAFSTATSLCLTYRKWEVVVPSLLYAGFVGYSRMRLGMHYPSDVLGGMVIGIGSGLLIWSIDKRIRKHHSDLKSKELSP